MHGAYEWQSVSDITSFRIGRRMTKRRKLYKLIKCNLLRKFTSKKEAREKHWTGVPLVNKSVLWTASNLPPPPQTARFIAGHFTLPPSATKQIAK